MSLSRYEQSESHSMIKQLLYSICALGMLSVSTVSAQNGNTIAAGNLTVIQNDNGNARTSVTVTLSNTVNGFKVNAGSNRGDYNIGVGANGTADFAAGVFMTSVRQNGRDNSLAPNMGGGLANQAPGTLFATSAIEFNATSIFIPVSAAGTTGNGDEDNSDVSAAYFRYSDGWLGGHLRNANNGGVFTAAASSLNSNIALASGTPPATGSYFLDGSTLATPLNGQHTLNINASTGNNASQNGILLVTGGKNEDNYALSRANTDGSFTVFGHDNGQDGAGYEQDGVAFVFVAAGTAGVTSGRVQQESTSSATLVAGVGSDGAGLATITQQADGIYLLQIADVASADAGVLIISAEGGNGDNVDNIVTYEWSISDQGWLIQSRDLNALNLENGSIGADIFSYAFVPVPEPSLILGTSMLGMFAVSRLRRRLRA